MDNKQAGWAAVALVAIGAAAVGYVIARNRSRGGAPEAVEPQVERWEGEGGNVPDAETPAAG